MEVYQIFQKLFELIHQGLEAVRGVLPKTLIFGFITVMDIILIIITLLASYFINKRFFVSINWKWFFIVGIVIFAILRFL